MDTFYDPAHLKNISISNYSSILWYHQNLKGIVKTNFVPTRKTPIVGYKRLDKENRKYHEHLK